ncbi:RNA polymerase II mediator complex subunit [Tilletia horrida]|nr:RNA polymerase II mediator complex subunit [Tilletia horrida]
MSRGVDPRHREQWQGRSMTGAASNAGSSGISSTGASTIGTAGGGSSIGLASSALGRSHHGRTRASEEDEGGSRAPPSYTLDPPAFRPYLHPYAAGLATPDFYPATQDQPEFTFDTQITRDGFQSRSQTQIASEAFSVHNLIYERLSTPGVLSTLTALLHNVVHMRLPSQACPPSLASGISAHSFRPPNRVTLNDLKLGNYIRQLADPSVPLHRLARSVPHGSKGERLLDMLWLGAPPPAQQSSAYSSMSAHGLRISASSSSNAAGGIGASGSASGPSASVSIPTSVPIGRAVWFIRVVGASDIQSARNRTTNYTVEWTTTVVAWLSKQLQELAVPVDTLKVNAATTPGMGPGMHATSPVGTSMPGALSSPITAGVVSPSSGPSSPVQNRAFGASAFGRQNFWHGHANAGLASAESTTAAPAGAYGNRSNRVLLQPTLLPRWISKWTYALSLIRALLAQQLLDVRTLFTWVADACRTADIAQAAVLVFFLEEVLEDMLRPSPPLRAGIAMLKTEPRTWWTPLAVGLCDRLLTFLPHATSNVGESNIESRIRQLVAKDDVTLPNLYAFACKRIQAALILAFDLQPYLFLNPVLWTSHGALLEMLLLAEPAGFASETSVGRLSKHPLEQRRRDFKHLKESCDRMLNGPAFSECEIGIDTSESNARDLLEILETGQSPSVDHNALFSRFFDLPGHRSIRGESPELTADRLYPRVKLLLTWACRSDCERLRREAHLDAQDLFEHVCADAARPFVAIRLLALLAGVKVSTNSAEHQDNHVSPRAAIINAADVHLLLMRWLSEVDEAHKQSALLSAPPRVEEASGPDATSELGLSLHFVHFERILTVFAELERLGIFSFSKYIQRLTARGLIMRQSFGTQDTSSPSSNSAKNADNTLFGRLLRSLPIHHATEAQLRTRRLAIYGPRFSESREEAMWRRAMRELRQALAWMLDAEAHSDIQDPEADTHGHAVPANVDGDLNQDESGQMSAAAVAERNLGPSKDLDGDDEDEMGELFSDDAESEYDIETGPNQTMKQAQTSTDTPYFFRCSRFTQSRLLRDVVLPRLGKCRPTEVQHFTTLAKLFLVTASFAGLGQLILSVLHSASPTEVLEIACDLIPVHLDVWRAIGALDGLISALQAAFQYTCEPDFDALYALQRNDTASAPGHAHAEQAARRFRIIQCAWACVRLGALDVSSFLEAFADRASSGSALSRSATVSVDFKRYFEEVFRKARAEDTPPELPSFIPLEAGQVEEAASQLLQGALRHVRTASVSNAEDIVSHLVHFCRTHMVTLDEAVSQCGGQLWTTGDVADATELPAMDQGRVSFRAHRIFIEGLVHRGCASAEVVLRSMLLPTLKAFASGTRLLDDIVGRTGLACGLSLLRTVLLADELSSTKSGSRRMQMEKTLLLRQSCVSLLAGIYTSLIRAGLRTGKSSSSPATAKLATACASLSAELRVDASFRAAIAKFHTVFTRACRKELDGSDSVEFTSVLTAVASLVGPLDLPSLQQGVDGWRSVSPAFDALTAFRSTTELALAFECASTGESPMHSRLSTLRSIASHHYPALCLQSLGALAEHAFNVANSGAMLSCLLEAALSHIRTTWSLSTKDASKMRFEVGIISRLIRRAGQLTIPVESGSTDGLLLSIEGNLQATVAGHDGDDPDNLVLSLALLRQMARTSSFWTPVARQKVPGLFRVLLQLVDLTASDEQLLEDVLGTVDVLIALTPSDAGIKTSMTSVLSSVPETDSSSSSKEAHSLPLSSAIEDRIGLRLPVSTPDPIGEGILFASTTASALMHGRFNIQANRVWDHLEFIIQPDGFRSDTMATPRVDSKTAAGTHSSESMPQMEVTAGPYLNWLGNSGSLSLVEFDAKRTKDLVIIPAESAGPSVELNSVRGSARVVSLNRPYSERTHGDGVGGEPLIAAGLQTGAVNPQSGRRTRPIKVPQLAMQRPDIFADPHSSSGDDSDDDMLAPQGSTTKERSRSPSMCSNADAANEAFGAARKRKRSDGEEQDEDGDESTSELSEVPTAVDQQISPLIPTPVDPPVRAAMSGARRGRSARGRRKA